MNEILKIILSLSLSGTFLIFILLLVRLFLKERLSKNWQYYIWLAVIVRLLFPITSDINFIGNIFQNYNQTAEQIDEQFTENIHTQNAVENNSTVKERSDIQNTKLQSLCQLNKYFNTLKDNLWLIWLIIALMMFIHKITVYQSFVKYIKASSFEVDDINMLEQLGSIIKQNNIKSNIELYKNSIIASPLLIGFFRPCIVVTNTEISNTDCYYTLLHELIHYKRKDMFYKWLVQFTVCLHWFNPFVYLMEHEINRACELSCDEAIIKKLDIKERRLYGDTLLNAISSGGFYKNSAVTVTLNESKKLLKERLKSIMNYKKISKTGMFITTLLTIFICVSANAAGAYSAYPIKTNTPYNIISQQNRKFSDFISYENGIFYVFSEGVPKDNKPISGVTNGCFNIVLVKKVGYISIGPFDNISMIIDKAENQCNTMVKNNIMSQDEMNLVMEAVTMIKSEQKNLSANRSILKEVLTQQEILSQYGSFGISFDKNGKMLFNGELIRYFWDGYYVEDYGRSIHYEYANKDGKIDIRTIRTIIDNNDGSVNQFGELTGIIKYDEKDFDSFVDDNGNITAHYEVEVSDNIIESDENTISYYDEKISDNIAVNNESTFLYNEETSFAEGLHTQEGKTFAEIFAKYKDYGIEYKEDKKGGGRGNVYYKGKLVKHFADLKNNGSVFTYESKDNGEISVYTVYDKNGKLIRIDEKR